MKRKQPKKIQDKILNFSIDNGQIERRLKISEKTNNISNRVIFPMEHFSVKKFEQLNNLSLFSKPKQTNKDTSNKYINIL